MRGWEGVRNWEQSEHAGSVDGSSDQRARSSLALSDVTIYEPSIRGTAPHFRKAVVLGLRTVQVSVEGWEGVGGEEGVAGWD